MKGRLGVIERRKELEMEMERDDVIEVIEIESDERQKEIGVWVKEGKSDRLR